MKFLSWANGKKTYFVCAAGLALGIAQGFGVHIPSWLDWGLVFLGGATLRHGVQTQAAQTTEDLLGLVRFIFANVTIPAETAPVAETEAQITADLNRESLAHAQGKV